MKRLLLSAIASFALFGSMNTLRAQTGAALNFDGSNDIVTVGTSMNSVLQTKNVITVEAWIYPTSTAGSYKTIIGNYSSPGNQMQFDLRLQQNSVVFFVNCGAGYQFAQTAPNTIALNTWQHIAGVWDGTNIIIYINGVLANSACCATGSSFVATTNSVVIGGNSVPEMFNGSLDEIRIWTRPLCQGEIQNNMNGELALPQTDLLAYYQFNQGVAAGSNATATSLPDISGNGYNGTLSNFALTGSTSNWITPGGVVSGVNASAFVSPSISVSGPSLIGAGSSATYTANGNVATYTWSANAGSANTPTVTVSPTVTTSYSVVGTNSLGCVSNTAVKTVSVSPLGAALNFDGSDDAVPVGNAMNTVLSTKNAITVEAWIYPTSTTGSYKTIIGNYSQFNLRLQQNTVVFLIDCGSGFQGAQTAPNTVALNTWQHVAGVWDGTNLMIYINGVLANSTCCATGSSLAYTSTIVEIGGNTVPEMFDGSLDEIRVWTRALCQSEIQNNMNLELALPQTGLLAYYQFNEGISAATNSGVTNLPDLSGNGYNGTLSNFALTGATSNWTAPGGVTSGVNAPAYVVPTLTVSGTTTICAGDNTVLTASGADTYTWTSGPSSASYTVNPTTNSTYSVAGTTSLGCPTNIAQITVTVNPVPVIVSESGNVTVCDGSSGIFTVNSQSGTDTYQWYWLYTNAPGVLTADIGAYTEVNYNTNSMTINVLDNGNWGPSGAQAVTCIITGLNGCTKQGRIDTVFINPIPTVGAAVTSASVCAGFADTLIASGAFTYTWSSNAGSTANDSAIISPTANDTYTVTGTDNNGCVNTATVSLTVNTCGTGISSQSQNNWAVYPNPSNGHFTLRSATEIGTVEVRNALGEIVYKAMVNSTSMEIDLTNNASGIYYLEAQGKKMILSKQ